MREVKEETGLTIGLHDGFRESVEYYPKSNVKKQVVYFLGFQKSGDIKMQEEEVSEIHWMDLDEARRQVTFKNDKNLIDKAKAYLTNKNQ